jgi:hypothetical protein
VGKRKLTLSVREDLVNEVKRLAAVDGKSLSNIVEEYFESLVFERWAELLGEEMDLEGLEPTTESEIPMSRPKGLDAAKIVRESREERSLHAEQG